MNKQKHLNLEARILIETLLNERNSFKSIARQLNKDCTTISKEVRSHICFDKTGAYGRAFNDCRLAFQHECSVHKICHHCSFTNNRPCWTCGIVLPLVFPTRNTVAPDFQDHPMSVTDACNAANALWKSIFINHLMHKRNTNRLEVNPAQVSPFPSLNSNNLMM